MSGLGGVLLRLPSWRGAVILSYHRIGDRDRSDLHRGLFSATADLLDRQLRLLTRHFDVVTPDGLDRDAFSAPGRRVIVTFDDGYRDLYDAAFPVLQANRVPATLFLCSGFIDGSASAWWDEIAWMLRHSDHSELPPGPWSASPLSLSNPGVEQAIDVATTAYWGLLEPAHGGEFLAALAAATGSGRRRSSREEWISWAMARTMKAAGQRIGAHTQTHPILAQLPGHRQREEIVASLDRIEAELGERPRWLAYPVGTRQAFSMTTLEAARSAGVELAFSNYGGRNSAATFSPLDVRRMPAESLHSPSVFAATLCLPQVLVRDSG
jgi:peptidoglycan/xylan/chitin deacetylase (PgdA/CDA1 family)